MNAFLVSQVRLLLTIFSQSLKPGSYSHNFFEVRHMMVQELWQVHQKELLLASLQGIPRFCTHAHCASHRLNLCVVKSCKIQEVNSMMQTADNVCRFFSNSPKRQLSLEKWISQICSEEKRKCLKEMCRTRWVERHEALEVFSDLFFPIVSCLEEMVNSTRSYWNRETRSDANSYLLALSQFSFHSKNRLMHVTRNE